MPATDALQAIALGPHGEVYAPDARGAWIRTQPVATAARLTSAGRAGAAVVALGDGVIYLLADNGWSAFRLHQRQRAVMSAGPRAIAAVGRSLFALDHRRGGEPAKLGVAPAAVQMIGAGDMAITIATERGLLRSTGGAFRPLPRAPRRVARLITDRWALVAQGALDLDTGIVTAWPADTTIDVAGPGAAGALVAVGRIGGRLELITIARPTGKPPRSPRSRGGRAPASATTPGTAPPRRENITDALGGPPVGTAAVGVVVDDEGGAVVALADGRLAVRQRGAWRLVEVQVAPAPSRPGAPPARAP